MPSSAEILEQFQKHYIKGINFSLRAAYHNLLRELGNPHLKIPPAFHVAGTNGKGSTCAFLRAILETAQQSVHVYTSPHLINFHERIRIAGTFIPEKELTHWLRECERLTEPGTLSFFEAATATAFAAFAKHKADYAVIEVGLGGRLDATNVLEYPKATLITRLSYDHQQYLGDTMADIAREKAGIMKHGVPCLALYQPSEEARDTLIDGARKTCAPFYLEGRDWYVRKKDGGFLFEGFGQKFALPHPNLLGEHQIHNAGLAIAAILVTQAPCDTKHIAKGITRAVWPARLQHLTSGTLATLLPMGWELWLDGGHNDSAGEALAEQANIWTQSEDLPLHIIIGMLNSKKPGDFIAPLLPHAASISTIGIEGEDNAFKTAELAMVLQKLFVPNIAQFSTTAQAVRSISTQSLKGRILICGSLYLAGQVLKENGTVIG